jgi:hypothetical protein
MTLFGIELRKPTFNQITASVVMGVGLWVAVIGLAHASGQLLERREAGALLLVVVWACVAARIGLSIDKSRRHLACNLGISGVLLGLYQGALTLAS